MLNRCQARNGVDWAMTWITGERGTWWIGLAVAALAVGCGSTESGLDGAVEAGLDASGADVVIGDATLPDAPDGGSDAGPDAGTDAGSDAGDVDAGCSATMCGSACVDTTSDLHHCGSC